MTSAAETSVSETWLANRPVDAIALDPPLPIDRIATPALLLDEAKFERNVATMAAHVRGKGKGARPHAKTHKCPVIARRQIAAGAIGVCAAKVSEAWVLRRAGIANVLVTSPVVDRLRTDLIARMASEGPGLAVVVDSTLGVEMLEAALAADDVRLDVLIDLDPRMGRTGVREPDDVYRLAERIQPSRKLRLRGVQHYCGHVMHIEGHDARAAQSKQHWERALSIATALRTRGATVEIVSGGGTGTFDIDSEIDGITDLQVGSYIFMDQQYRVIGGKRGPVLDDFEIALTVQATAISQPAPGAVTVDCGFKGFASESIAPVAIDVVGTKYRFAGDEHGVLIMQPGGQTPRLGERVAFVTPHCDPTVNLYDYYWVHRDGYAHALWPITARGCVW